MSTWTLDSNAAKQGETASNSIDSTGAYKGKFTLVYEAMNPNNNKYIHFEFESESGARTSFDVYTHGADGQEFSGVNTIHALMACMKQRQVATQTMTAEVYDFDQRQRVNKQVEAIPALMNAPIGIFLQKEFYYNGQNERKHRLNLFAPFNAATGQTSLEVLNNSEARTLAKIIETVGDKEAKNKPIPAANQSRMPQDDFPVPHDDFEDSDIPF